MSNRSLNLPVSFQSNANLPVGFWQKAAFTLDYAWQQTKRPLSWSEKKRKEMGIPQNLYNKSLLTASVHMGKNSIYDGQKHQKYFQGTEFEHNLIRLDYVDLSKVSLERIRNFVLNLGRRVEELNENRDTNFMHDSLTETFTTDIAHKLPPPFVANIGYYPAMNEDGEVTSEPEIPGSIITYPFSNEEEAINTYKAITKELIEKGHFPAVGRFQTRLQYTDKIAAEVAILGTAVPAFPTFDRAYLIQVGGIRGGLPAQRRLRMGIPLHQQRHRLPRLSRIERNHVQTGIVDARIALVHRAIIVLPGGYPCLNRFDRSCGLHDSGGNLLGRHRIPVGIRAEGSFRTVVVMRGRDQYFRIRPIRGKRFPGLAYYFIHVRFQVHVGVTGDEYQLLTIPLQRHSRSTNIVVHPGGIALAITNGNTTLVKHRYENARVVGVQLTGVGPSRGVGKIVPATADGWQNTAAGRTGIYHRLGRTAVVAVVVIAVATRYQRQDRQ